MIEIWKDVIGYEGYYSVSNFGNIRREKSGHHTSVGRIRKPGISRKNGYLQLTLWKNSKGKLHLIHRVVAQAFIGKCPEGNQVNHKDLNKLNNIPSNLEYMTPADNTHHAMNDDRCKFGRRKFKKNDVLKIRDLHSKNIYSMADMAKIYKVTHSAISRIVNKKRWI